MFNMLKALQSRLDYTEAQRKKDMEQAEAQRKKVKALQSRLDDTEVQRKKDAEQAEALRKKDAEQAEALRKKDAEQAEALRKKDAEKAEASRKKDAEMAGALRKKDQADAREQTRRLITNIEELEYKTKRLEQQAIERDLERKQKDEATQRYVENLAGDIAATTDFLADGVIFLSSHRFSLLLIFLYSRTRPDSIESNAEISSTVPKPCSPHTLGWWTTAPTLPPWPSGRLLALRPLSTSDNSAYLISFGRREMSCPVMLCF
jgi:hypothetical protein